MVGDIIKQARTDARLSQRGLARMTGIKQPHLSDLEQGHVKKERIQWDTIERLCRALNLTPNDLMEFKAE
jgi:DNA-binding Xre family transcriptional regulator